MFTIIDGKPHFAFGKYKGISVDFIYKTNPNYIDWAINEIHNFDEELKKTIDLCTN